MVAVPAGFVLKQDHELKTKVEDLKFLLKSQQVALETIANIFTVTGQCLLNLICCSLYRGHNVKNK